MLCRTWLTAACLVFCLFSTVSSADEPEYTDWEHRSWIAKAGRLLSGGMPLSAEEIDELAPLTRDQIVDTLMARPDFGDAVLDFNLFYLGFKPSRLYRPETGPNSVAGAREYDFMVYSKPQAIAAAKAVVSGGDYFDLLNMEQPKYLVPVGSPYIETPPRDNMSNAEKRAYLLERGMAAYDRIIANFRNADGTYDKARGCEARNDDDEATTALNELMFSSGVFFNEQFDFKIYPDIDVNIACGTAEYTAEQVIAKLEHQRLGFQKLYDLIPAFSQESYHVFGVSSMTSVPNPDNFPALKSDQFGFFGFWATMLNSSTNYNRKRAAYVLKTYFCDDLTPLGVVVPGDPHQGDAHASEPGCQSCHYKLDPMAGFFKDKGLLGVDFSDKNFFVFDDNATIFGDPLAAYRGSWPTVGFIRSTRVPADNDYGTNLNDLYDILRRAPEVKQCLVRRMAEYYLGMDQVLDGGWLDHLTSEFTTPVTSSQAVRNITKHLVLSNTFSHPDPQADRCYDYYPATPPANALPCAVSHVVRNNCAGCHRSTGANVGGLDMSRWIQVGEDSNHQPIMSFPHLDSDGVQRDRSVTLTRIAERLDSADPARSMPKNKDMNAVEKARLYLWVTEQP